MDDIDRDIQRGQIGKREEPLMNPYPKKEVNTSKPYTMPRMDVNYHKWKRTRSRISTPTESSTSSGSGFWFVGFAILLVLGTKILGLW